jgi:homoserine O-acetyltransferase/O-succinyltransferase
MVESQYRLVTERLGLTHLHAVVGISMGGMQALEWAVRYPTFVAHIVSISGTPRLGAFDRVLWTTQRAELDNGVRASLLPDSIWLQLARIAALTFRTPRGTNQVSADSIGRRIAANAKQSRATWQLQDYRAHLGAALRHDVSATYGGNLAVAAARVRAKVLLVYSWDDHVVTADEGALFASSVRADTAAIASTCGHMMFLCEAPRVASTVRAFLAR